MIDIHEFLKDFEKNGNKIIVRDNLHNVISRLKSDYSFTLLKNITAIDYIGGIELIYTLYDPENDNTLFVSCDINDSAESVTDIYKSAIADENEIYDLFGVRFHGNANLKRLYMPDDWQGYPLKKDYKEVDERLNWNGKNV